MLRQLFADNLRVGAVAEAALRGVSSILLLGRSAFQQPFPDATIFEERYDGLVKSPLCSRAMTPCVI